MDEYLLILFFGFGLLWAGLFFAANGVDKMFRAIDLVRQILEIQDRKLDKLKKNIDKIRGN